MVQQKRNFYKILNIIFIFYIYNLYNQYIDKIFFPFNLAGNLSFIALTVPFIELNTRRISGTYLLAQNKIIYPIITGEGGETTSPSPASLRICFI